MMPVNWAQLGGRNFAAVLSLLMLQEVYRRLQQQLKQPPRKPPGSDKPPN